MIIAVFRIFGAAYGDWPALGRGNRVLIRLSFRCNVRSFSPFRNVRSDYAFV